MSKHNIKIQLGELGFGTIEVDGTDISDAVHATQIQAKPGSSTKVTLDLGVIELNHFGAEQADVFISDHATLALVALGWTPPGGDTGKADRERNESFDLALRAEHLKSDRDQRDQSA